MVRPDLQARMALLVLPERLVPSVLLVLLEPLVLPDQRAIRGPSDRRVLPDRREPPELRPSP